MPAKLYRVNLTQDEREHLLGITRRGQSSGRKVKRCLILCKADEAPYGGPRHGGPGAPALRGRRVAARPLTTA